MPAIQEFLASYAVKVDEAGLYRLQQALDGNREKASAVQAAFSSALSAVDEFSASLKDFAFRPDMLRLPETVPLRILPELAEDAVLTMPESLSVSVIPELEDTARLSFPDSIALKVFPELAEDASLTLPESASIKVTADLGEADAAASDYVSRLSSLRPSISANASGIVTAVANAVSRARSLVAGLNLSIKFTPVVGEPETEGETPIALGVGGRISRPTFAHIAEEGDPEYVIPVRNDSRAIPLLQQLFGELSDSAKEALFGSRLATADKAPLSKGSWPEGPEGNKPTGYGTLLASLEGAGEWLSAFRADLASATLATITNNTVTSNHEVSAPVNITVTSTGPTAEAVGKTVYNAAERALVRTLEGVFA